MKRRSISLLFSKWQKVERSFEEIYRFLIRYLQRRNGSSESKNMRISFYLNRLQRLKVYMIILSVQLRDCSYLDVVDYENNVENLHKQFGLQQHTD